MIRCVKELLLIPSETPEIPDSRSSRLQTEKSPPWDTPHVTRGGR